MRSFVDAHAKVHLKSRERRTRDNRFMRSIEVHELHKSVELVVGSKRRVAQNISQVSGAEHTKIATHTQSLKRSVYHSPEIDVCLAVSLRTFVLLRVYKQVIVGTHTHFKIHAFEVGEVEVSRECKRTSVVSEHFEGIKRHVTVFYLHLVLTQAHLHAIRITGDICGIETQSSIDIRLRQGTFHCHFARSRTLEVNKLVGHKAVEQKERSTVEHHVGIEIAIAIRVVGSLQGTHLIAVARKRAT